MDYVIATQCSDPGWSCGHPDQGREKFGRFLISPSEEQTFARRIFLFESRRPPFNTAPVADSQRSLTRCSK
jgi:hypothetical protein